eukprot:13625680-Ditylum_brightwellii.AAC.1
MGLHKDATEFLEMIKFLLSNKENEHIEEAIFLKATPQHQLLVKDQKKPDESGGFPMRLVIPTTNFTASFYKLGYTGIKSFGQPWGKLLQVHHCSKFQFKREVGEVRTEMERHH